jgi:hypothetical protein
LAPVKNRTRRIAAAASPRFAASAAVHLGVAPNIKQGNILIIAPFREDDPKIMINGYCPFPGHHAGESMIA